MDEVACRNEVGEMSKKRAVQLAMILHYGRILDRLIYPFDPSMGPGMMIGWVSRCSTHCSAQMRSNGWPRNIAVGWAIFRYIGGLDSAL